MDDFHFIAFNTGTCLQSLDDITFIYAEGLNMPGSEERFAAAELEIKNLDI